MLKQTIIIAACAVALFFCGCSKEVVNKQTNTANKTCMQFIQHDPELTCFSAALERIELSKDITWLESGPYTFFAPSDASFKKAGLDLQTIKTYDKEALKKIIYGHILNGRLGGIGGGGFYNIKARSLLKDYLPVVSRNYFGLFLNGCNSTAAADLGDGVVQKINGVALPGTQTIWETIQTYPELSMFVELIKKSKNDRHPGYMDFTRLLQEGVNTPDLKWPNSTALCPTNEAFARIGYQTPEDFDRLDLVQVIGLIFQHVSYDYSFTSDYLQSYLLEPGSNVLKKGRSVVFPRLLQTNIKASNGAIHIIDQVIL
ncbi:hypothetical protein HHL16_17155 [Pseudoflavitalea sp. G-6-1-2]|uniref:fasciclin domain-containing protein n=1 Tax=Pseudoflavitalea sp. G-6-1-2 TaxID=2728841 RepID=UPI00146DA73C|nr:fasciclin domain-containing protein [Pseudoflavitalea sp. G-6-1-2]NML22614.1 hypothetical protein [Pseudoflavitalea sp. G-6-1-2]